jgi:hypothetical protein
MTGRFLSVDPVLGSPGDPQSWNRYAYVRGKPLVFVDPDGKNPVILLAAAIAYRLFFTPDAANAPTLDPNEELIGDDGLEQLEASLGAIGGRPRVAVGPTVSVRRNRDAQVNRRGGGKTGRKTNAARVEAAKEKIATLKQKRDLLDSRANKTPEEKNKLKEIKAQIKREEDRLRASEEHARKGQGPR